MMVCAELGDRAREATFPLGDVIGDVRYEISVGAVGFAHDAILVIAVIGGFEPQCAIFLVGVPHLDEVLDSFLHEAVGVQRGLKIIDIELHVERFEVEILLMA